MVRDKNWEDDFNENDYDDHKVAWVERQRLKRLHSVEWWIYIGVDIKRDDMAKIGLTSSTLGTRATSSQNPFYTIYCAFKVLEETSEKELKGIETAVINMLWQYYRREQHTTTARWTEWFYVSPKEMREVVEYYLYTNFSNFMDCYWCSERERGVINGWENTQLLYGRQNVPYQVSDISNQPINFACLTPPGCGDDCDCW